LQKIRVRSVENDSTGKIYEGSREPQIPPLRCASVGMTILRAAASLKNLIAGGTGPPADFHHLGWAGPMATSMVFREMGAREAYEPQAAPQPVCSRNLSIVNECIIAGRVSGCCRPAAKQDCLKGYPRADLHVAAGNRCTANGSGALRPARGGQIYGIVEVSVRGIEVRMVE